MSAAEPSLIVANEALRFEKLGAQHDRQGFDCGEESLNLYLQRYARQNATRDLGVTWVVVTEAQPQTIIGYYTLVNSALTRDLLPADAKLPPLAIPTCLLARLAVSRAVQGQNLGKYLLINAFDRVAQMSAQVGIYALEVHALHERAAAFYARFGFAPLGGDPLHLYIPLARIRAFLSL